MFWYDSEHKISTTKVRTNYQQIILYFVCWHFYNNIVQVEKERTEYKKRVDRMEEEADTLKTETTMLKRDLEEVKIVTAHYLDSLH